MQAGECSLVFSLRAGNGTAGSPAGEVPRAVLSAPWAGQVLPGLVLSCPARALEGQVDSGNVLGCVSEWDQRREFMANPKSWGP